MTDKIDKFLATVWSPTNNKSSRDKLEEAVELLKEVKARKKRRSKKCS